MSRYVWLMLGDCRERLAELDDSSVAAFVCDPPYDLTQSSGKGFMGKEWDATGIAFDVKFWNLVKSKLAPNGIIKAFGGARTFHKMVRAVKESGFLDVRIEAWVYGQGMPKSTNISKRIDKQAGAERKVVGYKRGVGGENLNDIVRGKKRVRKTTDEGGKGVGAYGTGAKQVAVDVPITAPATELAKLWDGYGTALKPAWEPVVVGRKPS